jgi:hypothetical protein
MRDHYAQMTLQLAVYAPSLYRDSLQHQLRGMNPLAVPGAPSFQGADAREMIQLLLLRPDGTPEREIASGVATPPVEKVPGRGAGRCFRLTGKMMPGEVLLWRRGYPLAQRGRVQEGWVSLATLAEQAFSIVFQRQEEAEETVAPVPGLRRIVILLGQDGTPVGYRVDGADVVAWGGQ